MKLLLDTCTFLWAIAGQSNLSRVARELIENEDNELVLSAVSLWEIAIKAAAGKLNIPLNEHYFREHLSKLGINTLLPVQPTHVYALLTLPLHHKDPFDRLLAAQCRAERLILVSPDIKLKAYGVEVYW